MSLACCASDLAWVRAWLPALCNTWNREFRSTQIALATINRTPRAVQTRNQKDSCRGPVLRGGRVTEISCLADR
ncbi:hypothetical protein GCM10011335_52780 [Aureimonas glaciei]|uniref:Uncharacterized protein n=1 Tax=Aureimonas glaciei TaxID=1776957 RepID=A0A916YFW0_9HYPH|nr:hypothetical protein GCM10011335_52780 [Aureimonas glaciei]